MMTTTAAVLLMAMAAAMPAVHAQMINRINSKQKPLVFV
jgi:hypothetical protein